MTRTLLILLFFLFYFSLSGFSQTNQRLENQSTMFTNRVYNAITVQVEKLDKSLDFVAQNISWYPYTVELEFASLSNLTPAMNKYKMVVYPGKMNLFRLTVVDDKSPHDYSYKVSFMIGDYRKKPDLSYPYLFPFSQGKQIRMRENYIDIDTLMFRNGIPVVPGDTILCMRKGIVTSVPGMNPKFEQILKSNIEIMHNDGTVASYSMSEEDQVLVSPGQEIYPLQPLAILKSARTFNGYVFQLSGGNTIKSFNYRLEAESVDKTSENTVTVKHQPELIEKELSGREKKKLAKGALF